jgi:hypothetical protein
MVIYSVLTVNSDLLLQLIQGYFLNRGASHYPQHFTLLMCLHHCLAQDQVAKVLFNFHPLEQRKKYPQFIDLITQGLFLFLLTPSHQNPRAHHSPSLYGCALPAHVTNGDTSNLAGASLPIPFGYH